MNAVKGAAKTDAIAALLTALVEERRSMHTSMAPTMTMMNMMSMMNKMGPSLSTEGDKPKP